LIQLSLPSQHSQMTVYLELVYVKAADLPEHLIAPRLHTVTSILPIILTARTGYSLWHDSCTFVWDQKV
jgi:hypothetical protein